MLDLSRIKNFRELRLSQPNHVPTYLRDREWLNKEADCGFTLVLNFSPIGPEYFDSTFDDRWQKIYLERSFFWKDPVVRSVFDFQSTKTIRWSEIPEDVGDPAVIAAAKHFGLNFGAVISITDFIKMRKSFISLARSDSEFSDEQLASIKTWFTDFYEVANGIWTLTENELTVVTLYASDNDIAEIATHLSISKSAVKARLRTARRKTQSKNNASLSAKVGRANLF